MTDRMMFTIEFPSITLTVEQVWPDGDAPADPTAEDVVAVMDSYGSLSWVIGEWNLIDHLTVNGVEFR